MPIRRTIVIAVPAGAILSVAASIPGIAADPPSPPTATEALPDRVVELGRQLFSDPILSDDGSRSCATCHQAEYGFANVNAVEPSLDGTSFGRRNPPSLLNRASGTSFFWDGRVDTLEAQSLMPLEDPNELGSDVEAVLERLRASASYRTAFDAALTGGVTRDNLATALAAFQRTLIEGNSPVDRFVNGEYTALSDAARQGKWLFESRGGCWKCHSGPNFTDEMFHNTGVGWGGDDLGRFEVTGVESDRGAFKTPSLRSVARTAPYMHDGSLATLREVVEFYRMDGELNPHLDAKAKPIDLSEEDVDHLVAFLEALNGEPGVDPFAARDEPHPFGQSFGD